MAGYGPWRRDPRTSNARILSVLSAQRETFRNATEHGVSLLTTISDAGSTPAASTNLFIISSLIGYYSAGRRSN